MGETKLLTFDEVRSFLSDCERKITRNRSIFQDESYMREISRLEGDRDSYKQRSETAEAQIESLKRGVVPADWVCFEPTGNKRIRFVPDCLILDRLGIVRVTDFPDSEDPVIYRRVEATEASGNQSQVEQLTAANAKLQAQLDAVMRECKLIKTDMPNVTVDQAIIRIRYSVMDAEQRDDDRRFADDECLP